ncbi:DUF3786 domain-containing protein [Acetohalobium arabaticum]|uniref:DUF3786 domain-containing protein n=1 Tax=Acetohalobium arabaticum (strain ATCC 49924 / DSM 5501 / Z-7288) TaxID=574087 RepID=D9QR52_ACEAZ|nr:DUF3786 domain-containing protein [Acetohalobium arabaticum]ADL12993.1 conserved hypothetical protein [Acetohalobium arabaticum DSM 5501]
MSLSDNQTDSAGYKQAIEKATERLARTEPEDIVHKTGVEFRNKENEFVLTAFNQRYYIKYPTGEIDDSEAELPVTTGLKIIILHFLLTGNDWPLGNELISFRELPDGTPYKDAFQREAVKPIIDSFCHKPQKLKKAAQKLGAEFTDRSDLGFTINTLPTIPLTYLIWLGDKELNGGANILFDSSIMTKLHTEDIAFLGEYTTKLLLRFS